VGGGGYWCVGDVAVSMCAYIVGGGVGNCVSVGVSVDIIVVTHRVVDVSGDTCEDGGGGSNGGVSGVDDMGCGSCMHGCGGGGDCGVVVVVCLLSFRCCRCCYCRYSYY